MKKSQIWELLEIQRLLCDTDTHNNHMGLHLLFEFVEEYCLAGEKDDEDE